MLKRVGDSVHPCLTPAVVLNHSPTVMTDEGSKQETMSRISQTVGTLSKLKTTSKDKNIALSSKIRMRRSLVISIFLYACEIWTLTAELERKIYATDMRCFQRLLGISYRDHVTNGEVRNIIRHVIGPYEDIITTVRKLKLRWYWHITRSTGLAKMILQGTVQAGRRKGTQKKRYEYNISEWTGLGLDEALWKAEDREEWRKVVARLSLMPQRSFRLRDDWVSEWALFWHSIMWIHFPYHFVFLPMRYEYRMVFTLKLTVTS